MSDELKACPLCKSLRIIEVRHDGDWGTHSVIITNGVEHYTPDDIYSVDNHNFDLEMYVCKECGYEWSKLYANSYNPPLEDALLAERDEANRHADAWFEALQLCCQDLYATNIPELNMRAEMAESERDAAVSMVERLIEAGERLRDYAILVSADHPMGDGQMALKDKSMWEYLVAECKESQLVSNAYKLKETK